jgi:hypothetical protein
MSKVIAVAFAVALTTLAACTGEKTDSSDSATTDSAE